MNTKWILLVNLDGGDSGWHLHMGGQDDEPISFNSALEAEEYASGWRNCELLIVEITGNMVRA